MLQRVKLEGINLPRLYIAENKEDVELAMNNGIPFIKWTRGQDELIKILLRPVLEHMFPDIRWSKVLGQRRRFKTDVVIVSGSGDPDENVISDSSDKGEPEGKNQPIEIQNVADDDGIFHEMADIAETERIMGDDNRPYDVLKMSIEDYAGDLSSCVNIDVLQRLKLMPAFIGDILECVRINIGSGMRWREGYNKRLGIPVGRFNAATQLPNLIILDVSASIPRGISSTMIALIDTLRTQLSADLIITSRISRFYPMGTELPDPQKIRKQFGYGNETYDFLGILNRHIRGKHYGHVISFGDNDTPSYDMYECNLCGTIVEHVHHYHTGGWLSKDQKTGYAKWCHMLARQPIVDYDTSWCNVIKS